MPRCLRRGRAFFHPTAVPSHCRSIPLPFKPGGVPTRRRSNPAAFKTTALSIYRTHMRRERILKTGCTVLR